MKRTQNSLRLDLYIGIAVVLVYYVAFLTSRQNGLVSMAILLIASITLYFLYAFRDTVNLLDFKAVFTGVWMLTIGLAQLKLLQYQVDWSSLTWFTLAAAHVVFLLANQLSSVFYDPMQKKLGGFLAKHRFGQHKFIVKNERLFWISVIASTVGLLSFAINVLIKGYIPFFAIGSSSSAYYDFYTRFQIFYVASLASVGLSYYCIKTLALSKTKRLLLWTNIILLNFVLPILLVQRGTFLNSMLIFTAVVYLLGNRKLKHLLICLVLLVSIYFLGSYLRGFSNTQLAFLFQPKEITACKDPKSTECIDPEEIPLEGKDYIIPPSAAFLYSYLTVSHDNFNSVVVNMKENTYGLWQVRPFNVVLRNSKLDHLIEQAEDDSVKLQVLPHLNSFNLITTAYLDFGLLGVLFFMFLWSFAFGVIENFRRRTGGIFSMISYGICLIPIALGFFLPWMSDFVPWLYLGTTFLMYLASTFSLDRRA